MNDDRRPEYPSMPTPRRGWSRQGAARLGKTWLPEGDCYYCGVPGCTECGPPPSLLTQSGIIATYEPPEED